MGIPEIVNEIIDYVPSIDWSVSYDNEQVNLFETTIRYLGGLLSGYDLLSGPLAHVADSKANVAALLDQAQNLANNLSYAFDTPTGIPSNNLYFNNRSTDGSNTNGLATIGTLVLEWTHLSDLTGDDTYGALAQKGESYLLNPQPVSQNSFRPKMKCANFVEFSRHGLNHGLASSAPTLTSHLVSSRTQAADGTAEMTASTNI
jgi:mannosyl-oligosaccharide alpha-1,2-mannosidase